MQITKKTYERFAAKVCPEPNTGCFLWMAGLTNRGYGMFSVNQRIIGAHIFSYTWHKGEVPDGHVVHHKCNTPCCVNPDHLVAATRQQNMIDAWSRKGKPNRIVHLDEVLKDWELKSDAIRRVDNPHWRKVLVDAINEHLARTNSSYRQLSLSLGQGPNFISQFLAKNWKEPRLGGVIELCRVIGISMTCLEDGSHVRPVLVA